MLGKFNADLAAWSAFSLPAIPMWLGMSFMLREVFRWADSS